MPFCDTHTHIYLPEFDEDRDLMVRRALDAGVNHLFLPNIDTGSIRDLLSVAEAYPGTVHAMMGLHPTSVKADYREQMEVIEKELREHPGRYCAVGEIGIDLYWDQTFRREQEEVFARQLAIAGERGLPAVIHTRNSMEEALEICISAPKSPEGDLLRFSGAPKSPEGDLLRFAGAPKSPKGDLLRFAGAPKSPEGDLFPPLSGRVGEGGRRGVFHCFSGNLKQAERVIELGFLLGIGGVITYKNSGLQDVVKAIPLEYLLLETDAPFLTPVPFRGKRNEPAYIPYIAARIAELKQVSIDTVAEITTQTALKLFKVQETIED